ncbi:hypothetical protein MPH_13642 [Macrophomina phaseolina MS6]|uniref:Uncharacterized protein n=1 Tax=Macrophomina phaseolina (strain MS6) TaxID=1126212 RepID=K2R549_MACPH|nr:hypothetical protein MPH_13642 [Macrophomina phaseolina MS6]
MAPSLRARVPSTAEMVRLYYSYTHSHKNNLPTTALAADKESGGTSLHNCVPITDVAIDTSNRLAPRADQQLSASASASSASATAGSQQNGTSLRGGGLGCPGNDGYTGAQMTGLGVGVGVPFALAFFVVLFLLAREKKRNKALMAAGASAAAYDPLKQQEGEVGTEVSRHETPVQK